MKIIYGIDPINDVIQCHQSMIVLYNVFCIASAIWNGSDDEYLPAFIGNKWNDNMLMTDSDYGC